MERTKARVRARVRKKIGKVNFFNTNSWLRWGSNPALYCGCVTFLHLKEQVVQWKMAAPKKKLLYPSDSEKDLAGSRESAKYFAPIHQLGEFRPGRGIGRHTLKDLTDSTETL